MGWVFWFASVICAAVGGGVFIHTIANDDERRGLTIVAVLLVLALGLGISACFRANAMM